MGKYLLVYFLCVPFLVSAQVVTEDGPIKSTEKKIKWFKQTSNWIKEKQDRFQAFQQRSQTIIQVKKTLDELQAIKREAEQAYRAYEDVRNVYEKGKSLLQSNAATLVYLSENVLDRSLDAQDYIPNTPHTRQFGRKMGYNASVLTPFNRRMAVNMMTNDSKEHTEAIEGIDEIKYIRDDIKKQSIANEIYSLKEQELALLKLIDFSKKNLERYGKEKYIDSKGTKDYTKELQTLQAYQWQLDETRNKKQKTLVKMLDETQRQNIENYNNTPEAEKNKKEVSKDFSNHYFRIINFKTTL